MLNLISYTKVYSYINLVSSLSVLLCVQNKLFYILPIDKFVNSVASKINLIFYRFFYPNKKYISKDSLAYL